VSRAWVRFEADGEQVVITLEDDMDRLYGEAKLYQDLGYNGF
jgi:hypothetical protein